MNKAFLIMTIATLDKEFAEQKLISVIKLSEKIAAGDWPYLESRQALDAIISHFRKQLRQLKKLNKDDSDDVVSYCCADCRNVVARYHTFIGVILRSSNVRNSFEGFAPMRKLASKLLGHEFKVIFSSEWSYTPFAYPIPIASLERFVFIGLPACEAGNSLLIPLAGHEIGHALWRQTKQEDLFKKLIQTELFRIQKNRSERQDELFPSTLSEEDFETDFKIRNAWKKAYELAIRQCEEVFCDTLACWMFGEGFLNAFRYMLYPEISSRSDEYYPTNRARAEYLDRSQISFHGISSSLASFFAPPKPSQNDDLKSADEAVKQVVPRIISEVNLICERSALKKPSQASKERALSKLRMLIPCHQFHSIGDVINAGWQLRFDISEWVVPGVENTKKRKIIDDLVLKSFEVNEWGERDDFKHQ